MFDKYLQLQKLIWNKMKAEQRLRGPTITKNKSFWGRKQKSDSLLVFCVLSFMALKIHFQGTHWPQCIPRTAEYFQTFTTLPFLKGTVDQLVHLFCDASYSSHMVTINWSVLRWLHDCRNSTVMCNNNNITNASFAAPYDPKAVSHCLC